VLGNRPTQRVLAVSSITHFKLQSLPKHSRRINTSNDGEKGMRFRCVKTDTGVPAGAVLVGTGPDPALELENAEILVAKFGPLEVMLEYPRRHPDMAHRPKGTQLLRIREHYGASPETITRMGLDDIATTKGCGSATTCGSHLSRLTRSG
jgi:hypothetical protein